MALKKLYIAFAFLFTFIISAPFAILLCEKSFDVQFPKIKVYENRPLATFPDLSKTSVIYDLPNKLTKYFADNLPFRTYFLTAYILTREVKLQSPGSYMIAGQDGHKFMHAISHTVLPYLGVTSYSLKELIDLELGYVGMYAFFKLRDIPYYMAIFPDKINFYPDKLPFWAYWQNGTPRYEQLMTRLGHYPFVLNFLNILKKNNIELHNKIYDIGHWNAYGLDIFHQEIGKIFQKDLNIKLPEQKHYEIVQVDKQTPPFPSENVPFIKMINADRLKLVDKGTRWEDTRFIHNTKPPNDKTIWIASDSYLLSTHTLPLKNINTEFSTLAFMFEKYIHMHYQTFTLANIFKTFSKHKPDVVFEAFVERMYGNRNHAEDSYLRTLGDALIKTPGYFLMPELMQNLQASTPIVIHEHTARFVNSKTGKLTQVNLPSVKTNADGRAMLAANIKSLTDTTLCFNFMAENEHDIDTNNNMCIQLKRGNNFVHQSFFGKAHKNYTISLNTREGFNALTFLPMPEVSKILGGNYGI